MNRRTSLGILLEKNYIYIKRFRQIVTVKKNAKKRLKILNGGYKGESGEFERTVVEYWKPYGIRPKKAGTRCIVTERELLTHDTSLTT